MARAAWQRVLFADHLRRDELLKLAGDPGEKPLRINVHRNHAFEPVAAYLKIFLAYAGWSVQYNYSDYDDSFGFSGYAPADLEILWIDYRRYPVASGAEPAGLAEWVANTIARLRNLSSAPVLISDWDEPGAEGEKFNADLRTTAQAFAGLSICPQSEICRRLKDRYVDARLASVTGTKLSGAACLETARHLGCISVPPLVQPRIKAIVTDLDNTLYEGVLGEDGPERLVLRPEHADLQKRLAAFRAGGVFLAVVSRNDPSDVERLFACRPDFPLRIEDFSARSIGWDSKSQGIRAAAEQLRIGVDAMLFIDDNPGEIVEVSAQLPGIRVIHAAGPAETGRALDWYPGLHGYEQSAADALRIGDLAATQVRAGQMAKSADAHEYLRALDVELQFELNAAGQAQRLHELSIKTNQFNTGFLRLPATEVERRLHAPGHATVSVQLRDRLSDSGVIAAVFARCDGEALVVDEIAISCRALGRQVEDVLITEAIRGASAAVREEGHNPTSVEFCFQEGPRNAPARAWLARYTGQTPEPGGRISVPVAELCERNFGVPVSLLWKATAGLPGIDRAAGGHF